MNHLSYSGLIAFTMSFLPMPAEACFQDIPAKQESVEERLAKIESRLGQLEKRLDEALAVERGERSGAPEQAVTERLDALDQKIRIVQRLRELEHEGMRASARTAPILTSGRDGFQLRSADGAYRLGFRGVTQFDGRFFVSNEAGLNIDTFVIRRARPIVEGSLGKYFDFKIMPDFGMGQAVLQDLFLDAKVNPGFKIRVGKFKMPVGLEQLQNESDILFVERALPTLLIPNRDTGVQVSGDVWGGRLSYALGLFNGAVDGGNLDVDDNNGKDFAGRIFAQPFRNHVGILQNLGFGIGGTLGTRNGSLSSPGVASYRTSGQAVFFRYRSDGTLAGTVLGSGTQNRVSPQASYYAGRFGLMAEYLFSSQEVQRGPAAATLRNSSWHTSASYVLTGEKASYQGIMPKKPVRESGPGGWGAWEIAWRYSQLNMDSAAFPVFADPKLSARRTREWAAGLNWYVNRNVKFVLDYDRSIFEGGATAGQRPAENGVLTRLQFVY